MTGGIVCAGNWIVDIVHVIDRWPAKSELVEIRREVEGIGGTAAARVLARARAAGMVTCVDLVSKAGPDFAAVVTALLPVTDYLFCNEVEAALASGVAIAGPDDRAGIARAARGLKAGGVRGAVIVHTPALGHWSGAEVLDLAPEPASVVVNPLGAGDAFCAGVIWGIHQGWTPGRALHLGHRAAAACLKGETATGTIPRLDDLLGP